jgi:uncharacterized membrane protein YhaH (DUF805 family)
MSLKDKLFSLDGRLRRQDWWAATICIAILANIAIEVVIGLTFGSAYTVFSGGLGAYELRVARIEVIALQHVISLATLWPALAMAAKRAHDRDRSARTVIAVMLVSVLLSYGPTYFWMIFPYDVTSMRTGAGYLAYSLISFAASLYLFVVVGCLDGTPGPNRFGRSPKGLGGDPADKAADIFD